MALNLPSTDLFKGYTYRYGSIEYIVIGFNSDGDAIWSAKGINANPDNYIAKLDEFVGDITGKYDPDGSGLTVEHANNADTATTAQSASFATNAGSATTATTADKATNADYASSAGSATTAESATTASSATTAGSATTANEAGKVSHSLSLTFQPAVGPSTTITYDGSSAQSLTFTDTDIAQDVITLNSGTGIEIGTNNEISITSEVARNSSGDVVDGNGTKLNANNADKLGTVAANQYALKSEIPTNTDTTYSAGTGIDITGTNNAISIESDVARAGVANNTDRDRYVQDGNNQNLKVRRADRAKYDENGLDLVNQTELTNALSAIDLTVDSNEFGADVHWDDYEGDNDDLRFGQFVRDVNNGVHRSMFVPGRVTITLTRQHVFNLNAEGEADPVGLVGPPGALGRNRPGIVFDAGQSNTWVGGFGLWCQGGIRARNFKFDGPGSGPDDLDKKPEGIIDNQDAINRSPGALIMIGGDAGSGNEDDVDSSFIKCDFGEKRGGTVVIFNGRNVNVGDCAFSNLQNTTGILMQWNGIEEDNTKPDQLRVTSWRKNRIYDNQFHGSRDNLFIQVEGDHPIAGLIVSNNIVDLGAEFIKFTRGGVNGFTFNGNSWYGRTLPDRAKEGAIKFDAGPITGACISGNTFSGFNTESSNRPDHFISSIGEILGLAITGNCFSFCNDEAIAIGGGQQSRVTVTGNSFWNADQLGDAFTSGCAAAANVIN